ncbi:RagB/SusD family nutrient uptake outer membrane protein [uncultured Bacteroides sp.]|uniref:RagB/SusD family nutrient uptake outer membrane protein n=1 Tax=uncultured Bacteroides sp. TaxID=162156 RepID=UPI002AABFCAA|nr:RagB/SusD family nutrient uptake outer membrane protein [uncultured Bacteroides sp.]
MKTLKYKSLASALFISMIMGTSSCTNDLNTVPLDPQDVVSELVFSNTIDAYQQSLAKIYAGLAMSGNAGGDGDSDVAGVDGGSQASFLRGLWNLQELTTDEAHCCWNDVGMPDFNNNSWSSSNVFIKGLYYRLYYQVNLANAFLRETTDEKLASRGADETVKTQVKTYRAEARFMRALAYYYLLDMFRNVPFVTETSTVGTTLPQQIMANDLFAYVEKELTECVSDMQDPTVGYNASYGHANKAAAWSLLSRLYLNAKTYIGTDKYTECITYCNKVITAGYTLEPVYANMFKADNDHSKEMILPIRYEGVNTQTWGGMTFLLCSGEPSSMQSAVNAVGAWQGNRGRSSMLKTFEKENGYNFDTRKSMLHTELTTNIEIASPGLYTNNGIPVVKYYNVNKDGSLPASNIAYTDFPLFRLGEIYLNYAEAVLRGGTGGDKTTALKYVNDLRARAYSDIDEAPIATSELTLDFILEERGREFFFEAQRRTDLVRFGKYSGSSYVWPWKGGVAAGKSISDIYNVFPIPADDMGANTNLVQNSGY